MTTNFKESGYEGSAGDVRKVAASPALEIEEYEENDIP